MAELIGELAGTAFRFSENTFDRIPISMCDVPKSEAIALEYGAGAVSATDGSSVFSSRVSARVRDHGEERITDAENRAEKLMQEAFEQTAEYGQDVETVIETGDPTGIIVS